MYSATALVGVGYAGAQVFPMAMLPDAAAVDARRTGENRAGVYTGVWTAGETLGLALLCHAVEQHEVGRVGQCEPQRWLHESDCAGHSPAPLAATARGRSGRRPRR